MIKSNLRKKLINRRRLKSKKKIKVSISFFYNLIKNYTINNKIVGGYYPVNNEVDDLDLLKDLKKKKINISLPVIGKNFNMNFYSWSFNSILYLNKYGIPEPQKKKLVYPDILLIPLVAFDKRKYRLGYGGGFYDRYIEKLLKKKKSLLVGLAHSCQKIVRVPNKQYDKKLDVIITEKCIIR